MLRLGDVVKATAGSPKRMSETLQSTRPIPELLSYLQIAAKGERSGMMGLVASRVLHVVAPEDAQRETHGLVLRDLHPGQGSWAKAVQPCAGSVLTTAGTQLIVGRERCV